MHAETSSTLRCTACGAQTVRVFVELTAVPVHCNLLWPDHDGALGAPRGDMRLGFCSTCGHVFNTAFDPRLMEYTQAYENSLHFSPRFQAYAEDLADRLIARHNVRNTDVIDIGCGKGDFLALLCERGNNKGYGFDPSYVPEIMPADRAARMTIVRDFYSPAYTSYKADLITCRHVLEHIQFPRDFVTNVREAVGSRTSTVVFFEVPNVLYTLKDLGIWDLIYEHCSYFSGPSLASVFRACGFAVKELHELYEGQFLGISTTPDGTQTPASPASADVSGLAAFVDTFADSYRAKVGEWHARFSSWSARGERVAVWGGGSKGVTFLNTLKPGETVGCMVDINPRKQGMFVAGTGQKVVSPEYLKEYRPDAVVIMNPIYRDEIREQLKDLGVPAPVVVA
jgi:SAM-dependent methyltransferase